VLGPALPVATPSRDHKLIQRNTRNASRRATATTLPTVSPPCPCDDEWIPVRDGLSGITPGRLGARISPSFDGGCHFGTLAVRAARRLSTTRDLEMDTDAT